MQTGETAWNPTGVGRVSLCAGLHGGRWSHRVVEVFSRPLHEHYNICVPCRSVVTCAFSDEPFKFVDIHESGGSLTMFEAILAACDPAALLFGSVAERYRRGLLAARDHQRRKNFERRMYGCADP